MLFWATLQKKSRKTMLGARAEGRDFGGCGRGKASLQIQLIEAGFDSRSNQRSALKSPLESPSRKKFPTNRPRRCQGEQLRLF